MIGSIQILLLGRWRSEMLETVRLKSEIDQIGLRSKSTTIASALAGPAVFSQAQGFAQQYRQRIGGAVYEIKVVVADIDKDAADSLLSRSGALNKLTGSTENFSCDRGLSMTRTIARYERLNQQQGRLEQSHPVIRPLLVLKNPDSLLINRVRETFEPAVRLTGPGLIYGGFGALLTILLAGIGISGAGRLGKRHCDRNLLNRIEAASPVDTGVTRSDADRIDKYERGNWFNLNLNRTNSWPCHSFPDYS